MAQTTRSFSFARQNPVRTGVFAVLGVIALGVAAGFALGYDLPAKAYAQITILPPITVVAPPVTTPVIVPTIPVIVPVPVITTPATPVADVVVTAPRPGDEPTDLGDIVVTAPRPDVPATPVDDIVVTAPRPETDPFTPPCCTDTTPTTVTTPVTTTPTIPPSVITNPFTPPCCTVPVNPPVVPPVIPPVVPPVIIPPVVPPVTPPPTSIAQCVFLTGTPTQITPGQTVTLSWLTRGALTASINNGIGVIPAEGSLAVHPTQTTTYILTATAASGSVNCQTTVTVVDRPTTAAAECVFLDATPNYISAAGQPVKLTWMTRNATSVSIDNGIGQVSPVSYGSVTVNPTRNTTYILTATGATGSVNCQTAVAITDTPPASQCVFLNATPSSINAGDAVTLAWKTINTQNVSITNIGQVAEEGSTTVNPTQETTYVLTGTGTNGTAVTCQARVVIESTTCTSNCGGGGGGGGGGGRRSPRVVLDSFVPDLEEPLSFVYLSEAPYTGLELGAWGTVLYWVMLVGWSLALAYLVLFNAVPFALARAKSFGGSVKEAMNSDASHDSHVAPVAHAVPDVGHGHAAAAYSAHALPAAPAKPQGYNAHDGFRSFAAGEGLTIDDIVKGLSREIEQKHEAPAAPTHQEVMQAVHEAPAAPAMAPIAYAAPKAAPAAMPMSQDVRDFIAALLNGDRDTVFGMVRSMARQGEDTEAFVSHAACALDDAYRACIDGTTCHPDIAELTNGCHPSFLERLVHSLSGAVDGSYSSGMTGVKMALTRALGVVAG